MVDVLYLKCVPQQDVPAERLVGLCIMKT